MQMIHQNTSYEDLIAFYPPNDTENIIQIQTSEWKKLVYHFERMTSGMGILRQ